MATTRKPGAGRKKLPPKKKKIQIAFRAEPDILAALQRVAGKNDRTVSAESAHAIKKHLREHGELADD